jgi:hypothetical protein
MFYSYKGGEKMKKPLDKKILEKESSFWTNLKNALKDNPAKLCFK